MCDTIDIEVVGENYLSVRDCKMDILDMSGFQWNFLFDSFISNTKYVYFWGWSSFRDVKNLQEIIELNSEEVLKTIHHNNLIFIKVKIGNLLVSRNSFGKLWDSYSNTALIFTNTLIDTAMTEYIFSKRFSINQLDALGIEYFVISSGIEENVIHVEKSFDLEWGDEVILKKRESLSKNIQSSSSSTTVEFRKDSFLKRWFKDLW